MENYYLIDYENVGGSGFIGCENLKKEDHIIIFFTQNARKIDMREIANHGGASLDMKEVPAGRQSADIHICSYLGYLAGCNANNTCRVVIVSKDSDFDNVIEFWNKQGMIEALRVTQINEPKANKVNKSKQTKQKKEPQSEGNEEAKNSDKTAINAKIMQLLSKAGFDAEISTKVASVVVKNLNNKNYKQQIYRNIISVYGQNKGLNIYNNIKKHI